MAKGPFRFSVAFSVLLLMAVFADGCKSNVARIRETKGAYRGAFMHVMFALDECEIFERSQIHEILALCAGATIADCTELMQIVGVYQDSVNMVEEQYRLLLSYCKQMRIENDGDRFFVVPVKSLLQDLGGKDADLRELTYVLWVSAPESRWCQNTWLDSTGVLPVN